MNATGNDSVVGPACLEDFRGAGSALARAHAAEVPALAPAAFERAKALWVRAQVDTAAGILDREQTCLLLEQAVSELDAAQAVAERTRRSFGDLVTTRRDLLLNSGARLHAPRVVNDFEAEYELTISAAEDNDVAGANEHAVAARELDRLARLAFVERGVIDHLEHDVLHGGGALASNSEAVAKLKNAADRARAGEISPDTVLQSATALRRMLGSPLDPGDVGPGGGVFLPPEDDWAPGTFEPPPAPQTIRVIDRGAASVTVTWENRSGIQTGNQLLRQTSGGPWEVAADFGPLTGWTTHTDAGLAPDTSYCYRVRSINAYGSNTTLLGHLAGGHTRSAESCPGVARPVAHSCRRLHGRRVRRRTTGATAITAGQLCSQLPLDLAGLRPTHPRTRTGISDRGGLGRRLRSRSRLHLRPHVEKHRRTRGHHDVDVEKGRNRCDRDRSTVAGRERDGRV